MKVWFLNILMLVGFVTMYQLGLFELIATKNFKYFSYVLVIILFVIAFLIVGNPFNDKKK